MGALRLAKEAAEKPEKEAKDMHHKHWEGECGPHILLPPTNLGQWRWGRARGWGLVGQGRWTMPGAWFGVSIKWDLFLCWVGSWEWGLQGVGVGAGWDVGLVLGGPRVRVGPGSVLGRA